jgi:hypothetical protein
MTDAEAPPRSAPKKDATRVVAGEVQEFDGIAWVPFQYLPAAGSGGDGRPLVIYKFVGDYEVDG